MAGSKGASKSGAASAARGARSNGARMERIVGVGRGFNCYGDGCALALRNVVGVVLSRGGGIAGVGSVNRMSVKEDEVAPTGSLRVAQAVAGDKEARLGAVWFAKEWKTSISSMQDPLG
jgi:hypothetical protein